MCRQRKNQENYSVILETPIYGGGLGNQIIALIEEQARILGLTSLCLRVLSFNYRAISLYRKSGYIEIEKDDKSIYMIKIL